MELSEYVHRLSRQLHPAIIENLGIAVALRSLCEELEQNESVMIDFQADAIPADVPNGHALSQRVRLSITSTALWKSWVFRRALNSFNLQFSTGLFSSH